MTTRSRPGRGGRGQELTQKRIKIQLYTQNKLVIVEDVKANTKLQLLHSDKNQRKKDHDFIAVWANNNWCKIIWRALELIKVTSGVVNFDSLPIPPPPCGGAPKRNESIYALIFSRSKQRKEQ